MILIGGLHCCMFLKFFSVAILYVVEITYSFSLRSHLCVRVCKHMYACCVKHDSCAVLRRAVLNYALQHRVKAVQLKLTVCCWLQNPNLYRGVPAAPQQKPQPGP